MRIKGRPPTDGSPRDSEDRDAELRAEQLELTQNEKRRPFAHRHPRLQLWMDDLSAWWLHLQRFRSIRFVGTFAILYSQRRAFGFSAEAAFWATFTLPWIFLGAVSTVAVVAGDKVQGQGEEKVLEAAALVLNQEAVDSFVKPLLDEVVKGSAGLSLLGFLVALWSGSRVFASVVEGSALLNGSPKRNYLETRGLALTIYVLGLITLALVIFSIVQWPDVWSASLGNLPGGVPFWFGLVMLVAAIAASTSMMWLANPRRGKWYFALPGGLLSLVIWLAGSWGLSLYLSWLLRDGSLYGAIAAPIAVMLWILVATMAMFIGITLNASILLFRDVSTKNHADLEHREESALLVTGRVIAMAEAPGLGDDPGVGDPSLGRHGKQAKPDQ